MYIYILLNIYIQIYIHVYKIYTIGILINKPCRKKKEYTLLHTHTQEMMEALHKEMDIRVCLFC